jgi:DNA-binding LacI/PurR family transcriptional regulator
MAQRPQPFGLEQSPAWSARGRRPGSTDVARLAGVSQKTVSRVLNDEPHVSAQLRERVLDAARELGYRPNRAARALTSGRTYRIGVASLGTSLYGPSTLLVALERAARSTGYALSVVNTFEGEPGGVVGAVDTLLEQGVDGIVLSEPIDEAQQPLSVDVPVLTLGPFPQVSAPKVLTAGLSASAPAAAATDHLLSLGHGTVHHLAGPQRWWSARERLEGWRAALRRADAVEPEYVEGDWTPASGYQVGRRFVADPDCTAVLVANDEMAIGLVRALTESGRRVPEDVSVVGFDDIPAAAFLSPPLTTLRQDFGAVATAGLAQLTRYLDDPDAPAEPVAVAPIELVVRQSTGRPARTRRRRR